MENREGRGGAQGEKAGCRGKSKKKAPRNGPLQEGGRSGAPGQSGKGRPAEDGDERALRVGKSSRSNDSAPLMQVTVPCMFCKTPAWPPVATGDRASATRPFSSRRLANRKAAGYSWRPRLYHLLRKNAVKHGFYDNTAGSACQRDFVNSCRLRPRRGRRRGRTRP